MMNVIVVGAGIVGSSVAYRVAQGGAKVTVLEADARHVVAVKITPGGPGTPDTTTA